jgi:hypothetical protein
MSSLPVERSRHHACRPAVRSFPRAAVAAVFLTLVSCSPSASLPETPIGSQSARAPSPQPAEPTERQNPAKSAKASTDDAQSDSLTPAATPPTQPVVRAEAGLNSRFNAALREHQNLDTATLSREWRLERKAPGLSFDPSGAQYFDTVHNALKMTPQETEIFRRKGVVSVDHQQPFSMGGAYYTIWAKDLPVLVTTDSILHALHRSYDNILKQLEVGLFVDRIDQVLTALHQEVARNAQNAPSDPIKASLHDLDLYLTVARNLMAGAGAPGDPLGHSPPKPAYPAHRAKAKTKAAAPKVAQSALLVPSAAGQDAQVKRLLGSIAALRPQLPPIRTSLYGGARSIDFSQFKPRGHYTETPQLQRYFRAMMWLGRTDLGFVLSEPAIVSGWTVKVPRERRSAALLTRFLHTTGQRDRLASVSSTIDFMVGRSDDLTFDAVGAALSAEGVDTLESLVDDSRLAAVVKRLAAEPGSVQQVRSGVIGSSRAGVQETPLPLQFQLFGQRFAIDSFVLSKVVFDSIVYKGEKRERMMPSGLDVMAALGNREAARMLKPQLEQHQYAANLLAAERAVEDYDAAGGFTANVYGMWLDTLRALDDTPEGTHFPELMRTESWQRKQLQTQLASWAELRHDTILYVKQSYTAVPLCGYPDAYVEPYPAFFAKLAALAQEAAMRLALVDVSTGDRRKELALMSQRDQQVGFFDRFATTVGKLQRLAEKELRAEPFTEEETTFLEETIQITQGGSGPPTYSGWYPTLIYGTPDEYKPTVADVHTDPAGGSVLEVGVGDTNLIVAAIDNDGDRTVYVGPVYTYYEFTSPVSNRLTDEQWTERIQSNQLPERPAWTHTFIAEPVSRDFAGGGRIEKRAAPKSRRARAADAARREQRILTELRQALKLARTERERAALNRRIARIELSRCAKAKPFLYRAAQGVLEARKPKLDTCRPTVESAKPLRGSVLALFEPTGEASVSVHLQTPDEKLQSCILEVMRGVRTKPFCGTPRDASISFTLE